MTITIHEHDVISDVCQRCAACCQLSLTVSNTDSRYRQFLRAVGLKVNPAAADGQADCCKERHDVTVDLGPCMHLHLAADSRGPKYSCDLHESDKFPQLCKEYNCVSWAKANNRYDADNGMLRAAQRALDLSGGGMPGVASVREPPGRGE